MNTSMELVSGMDALDLHDSNYRFDIFFIYKTNHKTRRWIRNTCYDLEKLNIVCGNHEKNFIPGVEISKNIVECIKRSRKVGVVVTPDFNQSRWCKFDLSKALLDHIREQNKIIPMFLEGNEEDIPEELSVFTGIDVSGHKEDWWDKLVTTICEWSPDNTREINYCYRKLMQAVSKVGMDKARVVFDNLCKPFDFIQSQIGPKSLMNMALSARGIGIQNTTVLINMKQFLSGHQNTDLKDLQSVFNQSCSENQICAALEYHDNDRRRLTFTPQCDIKLNRGRNLNSDINLVMSFSGKQTIKLSYGSSNIMTLSLQKARSILDKAASSRYDIQLRSRQSRKIYRKLVPYRVNLHSSRGCKNYRNYRKVRLNFPDRSIGRYTFFRDKFRDDNNSDRFLCLQKNDDEQQMLVF